MPNSVCVCGHARDAHEHFRRGTDCATCGPEACPRFRRAFLRRPAPPTGPSAGGACPDDARSPMLATGPLAIVTDFRAYAVRRLPAT